MSWRTARPRPVSGLRRKAVLATLALHGGELVSTGRLVDVVWGEAAPPTALNTLQSHVSYLRSVLGSKTAILARPPGYLLDLGDDGTDVRLAERLLRQGTQSADPVPRGSGPAGGAGAVARAAAGRRGRAGLAGGAGGTAGPARRAGQAGPVRGQAGGRGACAAGARPGADGGRSPAGRADPRAADAGAVPQRAAGRCAGRLPAAAAHPRRGAGHRTQPVAARPGIGHPAAGSVSGRAGPAVTLLPGAAALR